MIKYFVKLDDDLLCAGSWNTADNVNIPSDTIEVTEATRDKLVTRENQYVLDPVFEQYEIKPVSSRLNSEWDKRERAAQYEALSPEGRRKLYCSLNNCTAITMNDAVIDDDKPEISRLRKVRKKAKELYPDV